MSTATPTLSTEVVHSNERIQIDPPPPHWMQGRERTHAELVRDLEAMRDQILRHVDDTSRHNVAVVWDTAVCCTHCKEPVKMGCGDDGVPYCCDAAQAEWTASGGVIPE